MMEFPSVRRVGINGGFNIGPVSGELFLSNLKDLGRGGLCRDLGFHIKSLINYQYLLLQLCCGC